MAEGDLRHHLLDGRTMAILLPSLLATLVVWWGVASQGRELQQTRFRATVDEAVAEIVNRIDAYEQVLRAGSALFDASDDVVAGEWRRFVARLEIERRYPGIQGIGFARRVSPPDVTGHVDRIRATLYPDYRITPPGGRAIYFPIVFLEPLDRRNLRAIGYDMYAEPVRHAAMIRAAEQGRAIMSGKVTLVQEIGDDVQAGTLLYVPVYAHGSDLATVAARHAALQGFVYAPFRMADLFTAILGSRLDDLCVVVEDEGGGSQAELFANRPCEAGRLGERRTIDVNGRQWSVAFRATSRFETELGDRFYSYAVLVAGLAVTALLVVATQSLVAERRRREALIQSNLELEAARRQADAANTAKSRFLAAASHDLRQPLQTLGIYLHLLSEQAAARLRPLTVEAMQAFEATQRMLNALLDIAALESGRTAPEIRRLDMAQFLGGLADQTRRQAAAKGLAVRVVTCAVEVETDAVMLERLIRNLIDNAIKYTDKGAILIACRVGGDNVRLKVADSGAGIPENQQELIFEDFYQIANPERDRGQGLGLGLATASRLARLMGYRLELYSRSGRGSSFVVVVPRKSAVGGD